MSVKMNRGDTPSMPVSSHSQSESESSIRTVSNRAPKIDEYFLIAVELIQYIHQILQASSLFRDEGDMLQQVVADATGGVMTLGTGVCVSGDAACEGKRKDQGAFSWAGWRGWVWTARFLMDLNQDV